MQAWRRRNMNHGNPLVVPRVSTRAISTVPKSLRDLAGQGDERSRVRLLSHPMGTCRQVALKPLRLRPELRSLNAARSSELQSPRKPVMHCPILPFQNQNPWSP